MATLQEKHIKFLIIDSLNDDSQGMYELNNVVNAFYSTSDKEIIKQRNNALAELIDSHLVKVVWMSNPEFKVLNEFDKEAALKVMANKNNWVTFDQDRIYGVVRADLEKTIALENNLYSEIKTLHNIN